MNESPGKPRSIDLSSHLRGTVSHVEVLFEDGNFTAGSLEFNDGASKGHGEMQRPYDFVTLPIVPHVLGRLDLKGEPLVSLTTNPTKLREFCEDVLAQLDLAAASEPEEGS